MKLMADQRSERTGPETDPAQWVDEHGDYLYRFAVARLGSRSLAEDLVQETFLAALGARTSFSGLSAERTWFTSILKHKILDHLRTSKREVPASDVNSIRDAAADFFDDRGRWRIKPSEWGDQMADALEKREFWEVYHGCHAKLPSEMASAFSLRAIDQVGADEACARLHVTPGNLRVLLYRARMQLRRCLEINWFNRSQDEV